MALEGGRCGFLGILMKLSFVFVCWLEQSLWRLNEHVVLHKVLQSRGKGLAVSDGSPEVAIRKPWTWQWTNLWLTNPCPEKKTSSLTGAVKGSWYTRSASSKRCYYYCYHYITFHWIVCVPEHTCFSNGFQFCQELDSKGNRIQNLLKYDWILFHIQHSRV